LNGQNWTIPGNKTTGMNKLIDGQTIAVKTGRGKTINVKFEGREAEAGLNSPRVRKSQGRNPLSLAHDVWSAMGRVAVARNRPVVRSNRMPAPGENFEGEIESSLG
jgi:hypothetical protein